MTEKTREQLLEDEVLRLKAKVFDLTEQFEDDMALRKDEIQQLASVVMQVYSPLLQGEKPRTVQELIAAIALSQVPEQEKEPDSEY